MSANSETPDHSASGGRFTSRANEDQRYFRALEDAFIRLRGAPLLLSPEDWRQAQVWRKEGIPLAIVVGALEEVFRRRDERGAKGSVSSLRYCKRAVEAAWREAKDLLLEAPKSDGAALDVTSRLEALAGAVPRTSHWGTLRKAILALGAGTAETPDEASVESSLATLDEEALRLAEASLDESSLAQLSSTLESALENLRRRLPAVQVEDARKRLRRGYLRQAAGLPLLSLFAPEVERALESEQTSREP